MTGIEQQIFKRGSTTYYWSAKFFPKGVRSDVFKLYSFVRIADDYVDSIPQEADKFYALRAAWEAAAYQPAFDTVVHATDSTDERIIKNIVAVTRKYHFDQAWIKAFLDAMESDLSPASYETLNDTLRYVHSSAEIIGLMMSKIMGLPIAAYEAARLQGRAMQWINFIRDIAEDNPMGRLYFPQEDLKRFGLKDLQKQTARKNPDAFQAFIQFQIERYQSWQTAAEAGYKYIPRRMRLPLQTAANMYGWTASKIADDALAVFEGKIKPTRARVVGRVLQNLLRNIVHN
ncbi:MAG TPA: phytoene/squalene synthase family protein [Candidatus Saccharimonadales bacterium]|jgi:phytoene synthase|nr:phytoene/squalene synthase family protein [Candidatus Saccharimonadales bacterium]